NVLWRTAGGDSIIFYLAGAPFFLVSLIGSTCLLVRRFHDFDFSGYAVLIYFIAAMVVASIIAAIFGELPGDQNYETGWVQSLALLLWDVIPLLLPGSTVTNPYGPPPPSPGSLPEADAAPHVAAP